MQKMLYGGWLSYILILQQQELRRFNVME